jgi:hypothetical protein
LELWETRSSDETTIESPGQKASLWDFNDFNEWKTTAESRGLLVSNEPRLDVEENPLEAPDPTQTVYAYYRVNGTPNFTKRLGQWDNQHGVLLATEDEYNEWLQSKGTL